MSDERIKIAEVAALVGVTTATIRRWVKMGHFPQAMRLGPGGSGPMRWREQAVREWIKEQEGAA